MKPIVPKMAAIINVMYAVHRQPRWLSVINPPTIGPAAGPMKVAPANRQIYKVS
jgi:hypothetical protein